MSSAVEQVLEGNRPICQSCGDVIKGVAAQTRGTVLFCRKREQCHKASVRYKYYKVQKRLLPDKALEQALKGIKRA